MFEKFSLLDYEHVFEAGRESYKFAEVMKAVRAIDEPFDASRLITWVAAEVLMNEHSLGVGRPQKNQSIKRMMSQGIERNERQLYNDVKYLLERIEAVRLLEALRTQEAVTCEDDGSKA